MNDETGFVFTLRSRGAGKISAIKAEIECAKKQGMHIECDPRLGWRWVNDPTPSIKDNTDSEVLDASDVLTDQPKEV